MNYFAHGRPFVADPYFLAGTAVPDWLGVVARKVRVRRPQAERVAGASDPRVAAVARGIVQHHADDAWFHQTTAFAELSSRFCLQIRDAVADDASLGPHFLGHILVELLLDAVLVAEEPARLDAYYLSLAAVDSAVIEAAVAEIAGVPAAGLGELIGRFCSERFLSDYQDDAKLMFRVGQVLRRVGLPPIAAALAGLLPDARRMVAARQAELLPPDNESSRGDFVKKWDRHRADNELGNKRG